MAGAELFLPLFALFSFTEFFADINFVIKIFVLMTLIWFVKNHIGTGPIAIVVTVGVAWFVFFDSWRFFGGVYVLYMLLLFGISTTIIDFFFVTAGSGGAGGSKGSPMNSGADMLGRMKMMQMARGGRKPPMGPG